MAVFQHDRDYQNLDYRLLQESVVSLYLNTAILAEDISWLNANCYQIDSFDCSKWNEEEMHKDFFAVLEFPEYYGENLNAFKDCINSLEIPDGGGRVLVFRRFDIFTAKFPNLAWNVLDIIEKQSRFYLLNGKRFILLVHSDNRTINLAPYGCRNLPLNPKER